jgi:formate hydrogenlyase subunit 6/NADH:ubiquinone oxidoreductase subunit I
MIDLIRARFRQGYRTIAYPDAPPPPLPDRFRGRLLIDSAKCREGCTRCADACPTGAIDLREEPRVDLGRCLFCTDCADACPEGALHHDRDHRLAVRNRADLVAPSERELELAAALQGRMLQLFGRSLKLRQVSAGGCNACDLDINVLNTVGWDLGAGISSSRRRATRTACSSRERSPRTCDSRSARPTTPCRHPSS